MRKIFAATDNGDVTDLCDAGNCEDVPLVSL